MSGLVEVLETLVAEVEAAQPVALCVVVKTEGSAPQAPGATMLVRNDASTLGTVGGGASEAEVRRRALELMPHNGSALLELSLERSAGGEDAQLCGGTMSVGIMSIAAVTELEPFKAALEAAQRQQPALVPLRVEHGGRRLEYRLHLEVPPTLVMAGAGHVGQAVARLAAGLGFHVVVIDDRPELAARERFPQSVEVIVDDITAALRAYPIDAGCYVVIATRGHRHDREALEAVINRPTAYLGMIASQRKAATILSALADAGVPPDRLDRVHTPIGLPIGAVTVNEIAVSIMAELIQTRRRNIPKLVEGPFELRR